MYQLNLINDITTDIFNPLYLAGEATREGDAKQAAMYVKNLANLFFPLDVGDDPIWNSSASNVFKRVVFGMIDYFMEEEKTYRKQMSEGKLNERKFNIITDDLWGKLTLYNVYQMLVNATAKKKPSPLSKFEASETFFDENGNEYPKTIFQDSSVSDEEKSRLMNDFNNAQKKAAEESVLWEGKKELDLMTLFFNASMKLPINDIRQQALDADNSLKSMKGAEKMLSSVYGIATTQMAFFTDPRISALTSGRPSQNIDVASFSFPRLLSVKFQPEYLRKYGLVGMLGKFQAYEDVNFEHSLGKDFSHNGLVSSQGWVRFAFKGKFPKDYAYVKLEIFNNKTNLHVMTFYFKFEKSYLVDITGKRYVRNMILDERVIRDGILYEIKKGSDKKDVSLMSRNMIRNVSYKRDTAEVVETKVPIITQTKVRYSEKAKSVFLITPPHVPSYIKIPLILLKQLVDDNFEQAYLTKENQKPFYNTFFLLDELGNMQADGQGIEAFGTKLSIGLGQGQFFYLVLQTLQQLLDVYGNSADKIIQGNTGNIIFLKSNDGDMIEYLSKLSGTTHTVHRSSKSIEHDLGDLLNKNSGKLNMTTSVTKENVLEYNDFAYLPMQNSIVLSAGRYPIWNRNETILPFDFMLSKKVMKERGKEYSLQTIPSLSFASEFNVALNIPDFESMVEKRLAQAKYVDEAIKLYKEKHNYKDKDILRLNQELYADEIMSIINQFVKEEVDDENEVEDEVEFDSSYYVDDSAFDSRKDYIPNTDEIKARQIAEAAKSEDSLKRYMKSYLGGGISRDDLRGTRGVWESKITTACSDALKIYEEFSKVFDFDFETGISNHNGKKYFVISNTAMGDVPKMVGQDVGVSDEEMKLDVIAQKEVQKAFFDDLLLRDSWSPEMEVLLHKAYNNDVV